MTPYDQVEAIEIFTRAKPHLDAAEAQAEASAKLVDAVVAAAREGGLEASKVSDHHATINGEKLTVHLTSGGTRGWPLLAASFKQSAEPRWSRVEGIEYDPVAKLFVGTAEDATKGGAGGASPPRRSAVAVVAEAIVAMLTTAAPPHSHGWRR